MVYSVLREVLTSFKSCYLNDQCVSTSCADFKSGADQTAHPRNNLISTIVVCMF